MIRRLALLFFTIVFMWLVFSRLTELRQLKETLAQGQWAWVFAALVAQMLYYLAYTATFQAAFSTVNIQTRTRDLLSLTLGSLFVNVTVPFVGVGGAALFADDFSRRGQSRAGAVTGVLLQIIADYIALSVILVPGMLYLFVEHNLTIYEIAAAIILLLMIIGLTSILLLGIWRLEWLNGLFGWSQRAAGWLSKTLQGSTPFGDDWAQRNASEINQAASAVARHPAWLARTVGFALLAHSASLTTLYLLFRAFNQPIGVGALIAGYGVGILFRIISITPQGIGVVESVLALTFTSLGTPGDVATTVSLAFRGLTFWLPFILGFFAVHRQRAKSRDRSVLT